MLVDKVDIHVKTLKRKEDLVIRAKNYKFNMNKYFKENENVIKAGELEHTFPRSLASESGHCSVSSIASSDQTGPLSKLMTQRIWNSFLLLFLDVIKLSYVTYVDIAIRTFFTFEDNRRR